jgi:hypothetical protein
MACRFRRTGLTTLLLSASALAGGCGGVDNRGTDVRAAAAAFENALGAGNAVAMCEVLAPGTRSALESSGKGPCPDVIGQEDLPAGGAARKVDVYGRQARVVLDADTLFLSRFPGGWKIVAAGCRPDPGRPYECAVKGG